MLRWRRRRRWWRRRRWRRRCARWRRWRKCEDEERSFGGCTACSTSSTSHARARALLRTAVDIHAAAEPGGPTPLSLARLAAAGRAAEGPAAFAVLEAARARPIPFIGPVRRNTPLIDAVRRGRADVVAALIADGHDVNEQARATPRPAA